jgi:hypothetical protein
MALNCLDSERSARQLCGVSCRAFRERTRRKLTHHDISSEQFAVSHNAATFICSGNP